MQYALSQCSVMLMHVCCEYVDVISVNIQSSVVAAWRHLLNMHLLHFTPTDRHSEMNIYLVWCVYTWFDIWELVYSEMIIILMVTFKHWTIHQLMWCDALNIQPPYQSASNCGDKYILWGDYNANVVNTNCLVLSICYLYYSGICLNDVFSEVCVFFKFHPPCYRVTECKLILSISYYGHVFGEKTCTEQTVNIQWRSS